MTTIVTRAGKGSPLTHTEVDTNFTNLNTAKLETAAIPLGTLGAPSISFLSYSTTGIYSPAGDELGVSMLGSDKIRIKSTGEIIINATASRTTLSTTPRLQIEGSASSNQCSMSLTGAGAGGTLFPRLHLSKARSSVNAIVLEDDILGFISFNGGDGSSLVNAGFIKAEVDGTPSAGIVPGRLVFATVDTAGGSGERMIIKNNGNVSIDGTTFNVDAVNNRVGIGTTNPVALLQPNGTVSITGGSGASSANGLHLYFDTATNSGNISAFHSGVDNRNLVLDGKTIGFTIAGSDKARIDASGRLLVGTSSSPSLTDGQYSKLHVIGNTNSASGDGFINIGRGALASSGLTTGTSLGNLQFTDSAGAVHAVIGGLTDGTSGTNDYPGRLTFSTTPSSSASPVERMRIHNDGRISTGTTSAPGAASFGFSINRTGSQGLLECYRNVGNNAQTAIIGGSAGEAYIEGDGDLKNTNNSYGAISDQKLKENIVDASSQWVDIKTLQVRRYNFKEETGYNTHTQIGLVAQEVELVSPGLVNESPDRDEDGNDLGTVTKSVNYSVLYMKAVKALQEAMGRIETLEQRLTAAGID